MSAVVIRADARKLPLPDESVDLIVTSPPYWGLRAYTDGGERYDWQIGAEPTPADYIANLLDCTREWVRVLKPEGSLWVNLGDKYVGSPSGPQGANSQTGQGHNSARTANARHQVATGAPLKSLLGLPWRYALGCVDDLVLILRAEVIWSKRGGMPESVTDRVRRAHEQLFHFTKQGRYFAAVDEIREPHKMRPQRRPGGHKSRQALGVLPAQTYSTSQRDDKGVDGHPLGALPGSVWEVATQPLKVPAHLGVEHFAAFPPALIRRIILGWSPPGGVVLDPFGGTGTTALVADVHGRHGISADLSHDYGRLARWRTTDPGERARALGVPKPPPVPDGQDSLFEEIA